MNNFERLFPGLAKAIAKTFLLSGNNYYMHCLEYCLYISTRFKKPITAEKAKESYNSMWPVDIARYPAKFYDFMWLSLCFTKR